MNPAHATHAWHCKVVFNRPTVVTRAASEHLAPQMLFVHTVASINNWLASWSVRSISHSRLKENRQLVTTTRLPELIFGAGTVTITVGRSTQK